ncbi:BTAD domain-containing putative transcriptional regulator [Streptomyces sp. NPDC048508]|uniref:AfsR/SARP family transcriptional regulator n=1 Tax=Streptomyces sp. NPDC048508 TaxID=3365561 RepID=UPI003722300E
MELQLLDSMLRTAAVNLSDEDRVLPELLAIRLGEAGAMLYLSEPTVPVIPFSTEDGSASTVWWCPTATDLLLDSTRLRETDPPYPALLALGSGDDASIVLVDLEQIGAIHLTGEQREEVLRMAAISLVLSPLGGQMELAVPGVETAPGLATLDEQRVSPYPALANALSALTAHRDEQGAVLAEFGGEGLAAARIEEDIEELWPLVLLADLDVCPDPTHVSDVWDLLETVPTSALASFTSSARDPDPPEFVWLVDTNAAFVTVPGTNVQCSLSGCSPEDYANILKLVTTADLPLQKDSRSPAGPVRSTTVPVGGSEPVSVSQHDHQVLMVKSAPGSASPSDPGIAGAKRQNLKPDQEATEETTQPTAPGAPNDAPTLNSLRSGSPSSSEAVHSKSVLRTDTPSDGDENEQPADPLAERIGAIASAEISPCRVNVRLAHSSDTGRIDGAVKPGDEKPFVRVLGPVGLEGARGDILSNRKTAALELAAWLVLHPGANAHQIDDVLAPSGRISRDTRNSRISDVRRWLGHNAQGELYLPHLARQADRQFRLTEVECDWLDFQRLADDHSGDDAARGERLRTALDLVTGRPFSGVPARRYVWAEDLSQEIITKIVHVADDFAEHRLLDGDGRGALWAANRGLSVAREVEQLWRHRFRALALLGQEGQLESSIQALESLLLEIGCSMEDETSAVIQQVQAIQASRS